MPTSSLYLHGAAPPAGIVLPTTSPTGWTTLAAGYGAGCRPMDASPGNGQTTVTSSPTGIANGTTLSARVWVSPPLAAQTIAAATWGVNLGLGVSTHNYAVGVAIYLMDGSAGTARATIVAGTIAGANPRTVNTEITVSNAFGGNAVTASAGDYLLLELAVIPATGAATSFTISHYQDGTTAISADNVATSSALSHLDVTTSLVFLASPIDTVRPTEVVASALVQLGAVAETVRPADVALVGPLGSAVADTARPADAVAAALTATTTLYLRLGLPNPSPVLPYLGTYLGTWDSGFSYGAGDGGTVGPGAGELGLAAGAGQIARSPGTFTLQPLATYATQQFFSGPLAAQTVAAGNWTVAWAGMGTTFLCPRAIFVGIMNGGDGSLRTTLIAVSIVGYGNPNAGDELTALATLAVGAFTVIAGDMLVVELGFQNSSGAPPVAWTVYADGTIPITADNVITGDAQARIVCPAALLFGPLVCNLAEAVGVAEARSALGAIILPDTLALTETAAPAGAIALLDAPAPLDPVAPLWLTVRAEAVAAGDGQAPLALVATADLAAVLEALTTALTVGVLTAVQVDTLPVQDLAAILSGSAPADVLTAGTARTTSSVLAATDLAAILEALAAAVTVGMLAAVQLDLPTVQDVATLLAATAQAEAGAVADAPTSTSLPARADLAALLDVPAGLITTGVLYVAQVDVPLLIALVGVVSSAAQAEVALILDDALGGAGATHPWVLVLGAAGLGSLGTATATVGSLGTGAATVGSLGATLAPAGTQTIGAAALGAATLSEEEE